LTTENAFFVSGAYRIFIDSNSVFGCKENINRFHKVEIQGSTDHKARQQESNHRNLNNPFYLEIKIYWPWRPCLAVT
jgi:hypothetical protein